MNAVANDPAVAASGDPAAGPSSANGGDERPPQSGAGTIALALGVFSLIGVITCWLLSAIGAHNPTAHPTLLVVLGLLIAICMLLAAVGLVLGVLGAFKKERRKSFALIGLLVNLIVIISSLLLITNGNSA